MQQRTLARILSAALAGSVMAAAPTMVAAAAAVKKTAVKISLNEQDKGAVAVGAGIARYRPSTNPYVSTVISSLTPEVCKASYPVEGLYVGVSMDKPGLCTIRVAVADTANYTGSLDYSFTIPKLQQPHYYPLQTYPDGAPTPTRLDGRDNVYARLSPMVMRGDPWGAELGTPYQVTTSDPAVCKATATINAGGDMRLRPEPVAPGDCTITVLRPANDKFEESRIDWQIRVIGEAAPAKSNQSITFASLSSPGIGQSITLSATGGASGNPVTFTSQTPELCKVEGNVLTALAAGVCIVNADQQGNDKFNAAPQQGKMVIIKAADPAKTPQAITFGEVPPLVVGGTLILSATGGNSGNAVTFTSQTPAVCTAEGNVLTALTAGTCAVVAEQKGNDQYGDAPAKTLTVAVSEGNGGKTAQVIGINPVATLAVGGTATLAAFGGESGNPVRLSSLTPDVCTVNETTLTAVAVGKCTVAANQDGNDRFSPAAQATMYIVIAQEVSPYTVAVNITGDLSAQTITAGIKPASADIGKVGSEFLAAQLGEMVFLYGMGGWVQYTGADSVVALSSGALASHELTLLDNVDMSSLVGAQVIVGYGLGNSLAEAYAEMQKASRVMSVYKVE